MTRPTALEANRHPTWELVDIMGAKLSGSLVPEAYDRIELTYTGSNITQVLYRLAGVTVATLTLTYTGSQLDSVERS